MTFNHITITTVIIAITVVVSLVAMSKERLLLQLMMNPYRIKRNKEFYRFLTSGFVHLNHTHLLFNMFSFYFFGTAVESLFRMLFADRWVYLFIGFYLLAIIASDIPTYFKQKDNPQYNSLGASGGVAAIIFAFIIFEPLQRICVFLVLCMPGFILGVLFIAYSYYQGRKSSSGINHEAHLYGALFGLLFCIVLFPFSLRLFVEQIMDWVHTW